MEFVKFVLDNSNDLLVAVLAVAGAFTAFLASLYSLFLLIPGDQPDKTIKKILDLTSKISRK